MSADENIHIDVEGEPAEAQEVEREAEPTPEPKPVDHAAELQAQNLLALQNRARDLSLAITNPATLARKLRESLIDLVGPEQSRAYHIGASYDSATEQVQFQIATVTPNFLARLQVERGMGGEGAGANTGTTAKLEIAYLRTINGWEVAVGAGVTATRQGTRMEKGDVQVGASFSVTVRR